MKLTRSSRVVVASPSLGKLVLDGPGSLEDLEGPLLEDLLSVCGILSAIAAASDSDAARALPNLSLDELDKSCSLEGPLSELDELDEIEELPLRATSKPTPLLLLDKPFISARLELELLMAQERRPTVRHAGHGELGSEELDELESEELDELESRFFEELDELDELRFFEGFEDSLSLAAESCTLSSPSDEL
jgi:hypothetical protein